MTEKTEGEIAVRRELDATQRDSILSLVAAAEATDGVEPVNEQTRLRMRYGGADVRHLLVPPGAGYALLDLSDHSGAAADDRAATAEAVVHPRHRGQGLGTALVSRLLDEAAPRPLRIWAHGDLPAAAAIARRFGLQRVRELWQLRRSLADPLPEVSVPETVTVRTFRPGADEDAWLRVNARAFAQHPEQGGVTRADLEAREGEPWFDPAGFFLAEHEGELAGFHWTKTSTPPGGEPVGEVYVLGIDPAAQGLGLGRLLTLVGLHHLRDRGLGEVTLFVESDNAAALRVYEKLGFVHARTDVMYESRGVPRPR